MEALDMIPIKYVVLPNPQPDDQGRTTYQVRPDTRGAMHTRGLVEHMKRYGIMTQYPLDAIIRKLTEEIVEQLFFNRCMHIDGLGTFSLTLGLKPVKDEQGVMHKRQVTDPHEITGNDIEVTGIAFKPDKEFTDLATQRPAYFQNSEPRGVVGHSVTYTRQDMIATLFGYLAKNETITRRIFIMMWHLTKYQAQKWLEDLTTGDNPPLLVSKPGDAYVYQRNPNYVPET